MRSVLPKEKEIRMVELSDKEREIICTAIDYYIIHNDRTPTTIALLIAKNKIEKGEPGDESIE